MEQQAVRLTRKELYEKMWSRPAIALAEEFGISGRGLGKLCRRFAIPVCGEIQLKLRRGSERGRCSVLASGMSEGLR